MSSLYMALVVILGSGNAEPLQFLDYAPTQTPKVCEINALVDRDDRVYHVTCYTADGNTIVYYGTAVRAVEV